MKRSMPSGIVFAFTMPLRSASACHSAEYASPSNRIFLLITDTSRMVQRAASMASSPLLMRSSNILMNFSRPAAHTENIAVTGSAIACEAPGARNSNLFPVKATGLVLFLSLSNAIISGSFERPKSTVFFAGMSLPQLPSSISRIILSIAPPRYTLMMLGGASWPPSLYMLPGVDTEAWSRPEYSATPRTKEERKDRNIMFFL